MQRYVLMQRCGCSHDPFARTHLMEAPARAAGAKAAAIAMMAKRTRNWNCMVN
jgi:hypothetical protein